MNDKLTFQDIVDLLAKKAKISKKDSDSFLRELFAIIYDNIIENEAVKVKDFGVFKPTLINSRESVNVNTGQKFYIPAHYRLTFTPDKTLKELVNKPFALFESVLLEGDLDLNEVVFEQTDSFADEYDDGNDELSQPPPLPIDEFSQSSETENEENSFVETELQSDVDVVTTEEIVEENNESEEKASDDDVDSDRETDDEEIILNTDKTIPLNSGGYISSVLYNYTYVEKSVDQKSEEFTITVPVSEIIPSESVIPKDNLDENTHSQQSDAINLDESVDEEVGGNVEDVKDTVENVDVELPSSADVDNTEQKGELEVIQSEQVSESEVAANVAEDVTEHLVDVEHEVDSDEAIELVSIDNESGSLPKAPIEEDVSDEKQPELLPQNLAELPQDKNTIVESDSKQSEEDVIDEEDVAYAAYERFYKEESKNQKLLKKIPFILIVAVVLFIVLFAFLNLYNNTANERRKSEYYARHLSASDTLPFGVRQDIYEKPLMTVDSMEKYLDSTLDSLQQVVDSDSESPISAQTDVVSAGDTQQINKSVVADTIAEKSVLTVNPSVPKTTSLQVKQKKASSIYAKKNNLKQGNSTEPSGYKSYNVTLKAGETLRTMGVKYLGAKEYWVYIYRENKNKISDPDNVPVGTSLTIPDLAKYMDNPKDPKSIEAARQLEKEIIK